MANNFKVIASRTVFDGQILQVRVDQLRLDDGQQVSREVVVHHGGAAVALQADDGSFLMVRQYRYGSGQYQLEFPAGKKEPGEDGLAVVTREVAEETGYEGRGFVSLGSIVPTGAYDSEVIDMFYARQGAYVGQHLDSDERLEVLRMTLDELTAKVMDNEIVDAKTIVMIMMLNQRAERNKKDGKEEETADR